MRICFLTAGLTLSVLAFAQSPPQPSAGNFNSSFDEQNAVLSPDGTYLYFTVANHPENIGGKKDPGDIWYSQRMENTWAAPVHAGKLINDAGYNGVAGFSYDGNQMFLLSHYATSGVGTSKTQGLSISRRSSNGWSKPENVSIPYYQNKSSIVSGYVSSDGKVFVYSAETYGSYGVEDIYVTVRESDNKWSAPRNLGATINTQFQELSPSLSADNKTLYFSTNGRAGLGSFDIYHATRLDDSWTRWSNPIHMGNAVNTEGRDLFFRTYPGSKTATFTSTINSDGYGDVKFYLSEDLQTETPLVTEDTLEMVAPVGPEGAEGIRVLGTISNAKTGEPINATISFRDGNEEVNTRSDADGYEIRIAPQSNYTVSIESPGFISAMERLSTENYDSEALEMNWKLQPIERGTTVNLKNVLFEQSKATLLPESYSELDLVVAFLQNNPNVFIELSGHTDNRGVASDNINLSQDRVETVKNYLVAKGIDPKRISGKGYGGSKPIASNDNEETRRLNRRVEFIIKKL